MIEKIKKALHKDSGFVHEYVEDDTIYLASKHRAVMLKGKYELEPTSLPGIKKLFDKPVLCSVTVPRKEILAMFDIAKKECDTVVVLIRDRKFTVLPKNPKSNLVSGSYEIDADTVTDFKVNPKYFAQILKWSKAKEVTIGVGAPKQLVRIECEFTALIAQKS